MIIIFQYLIHDEAIIKEKIIKLLSYNQLISLKQEDFTLFPQGYIQFELNNLSKLDNELKLNDKEITDIIINISSKEDVDLVLINKIIDDIQALFENEVNIIYGYIKDECLSQTMIDLFIIN